MPSCMEKNHHRNRQGSTSLGVGLDLIEKFRHVYERRNGKVYALRRRENNEHKDQRVA